jgi:hypothetical protein
MTAHEFENITEILDTILSININRCCSTTYDQSLAESVRHKIIQELAKQHGIVYNTIPKSTVIFPVTTHEKSQSSF